MSSNQTQANPSFVNSFAMVGFTHTSKMIVLDPEFNVRQVIENGDGHSTQFAYPNDYKVTYIYDRSTGKIAVTVQCLTNRAWTDIPPVFVPAALEQMSQEAVEWLHDHSVDSSPFIPAGLGWNGLMTDAEAARYYQIKTLLKGMAESTAETIAQAARNSQDQHISRTFGENKFPTSVSDAITSRPKHMFWNLPDSKPTRTVWYTRDGYGTVRVHDSGVDDSTPDFSVRFAYLALIELHDVTVGENPITKMSISHWSQPAAAKPVGGAKPSQKTKYQGKRPEATTPPLRGNMITPSTPAPVELPSPPAEVLVPPQLLATPIAAVVTETETQDV